MQQLKNVRKLATVIVAAAALVGLASAVDAADKRALKIGTEAPIRLQRHRQQRPAGRLRRRHRQGAVRGRQLRVRVRGPGLGRHHSRPDRQEVRRDRRLDVDHRQAQGGGRLHREVLPDPGQVHRAQGRRPRRLAGGARGQGGRRATSDDSRGLPARQVPGGRGARLRDPGRGQRRPGVRPGRPGDGGSDRSARGLSQDDEGQDFEFVGPNFIDPRFHGEGAGIAIRKGEEDLRVQLNEAIEKIRTDGTYEAIASKYFDFDVYGPTS